MDMTTEEFEEYAKSHNIIIMTREFYENRLKADLKAILVELQLEIEGLDNPFGTRISGCSQDGWNHGVKNCDFVIQQKINALEGNKIRLLKTEEPTNQK